MLIFDYTIIHTVGKIFTLRHSDKSKRLIGQKSAKTKQDIRIMLIFDYTITHIKVKDYWIAYKNLNSKWLAKR